MRKNLRRGNAEPERLSVALRDMEVCERREDGQFEYTAIAQFFNVVNDRLMVFRPGSFAKTIRENLKGGRIKINDGHRHSSAATLGTVIEAEERPEGVWYRGLISSTEEMIFTKMREGHVDENSIEFFPIVEGVARVPLADLPVGSWVGSNYAAGDGTVEARELLEVAWVGIAILPFSSQGRRALLETNAAMPFQDLPVASEGTAWDPAGAAERLRAWAGTVSMPSRDPIPNYAKLARGFLVRGPVKGGEPQLLGQIADVVDGSLVVVPEALDAALEELGKKSEITGPDLVACAQAAGRYAQKLSRRKKLSLANFAGDQLPSKGADDPAGPAPITTGAQPPTEETRSDEAPADQTLVGLGLRTLSLRLDVLAATYPEVVNHESTGPGRKPAPGGGAEVRGSSDQALHSP